MSWLRRTRSRWLWFGFALTAIALLVALSSTAYRGESSRDFPSGGSNATGNSGTGSDNVLALASFGIAAAAGGATLLVARVTRPKPGAKSAAK
jgi:hypothetical protein